MDQNSYLTYVVTSPLHRRDDLGTRPNPLLWAVKCPPEKAYELSAWKIGEITIIHGFACRKKVAGILIVIFSTTLFPLVLRTISRDNLYQIDTHTDAQQPIQ